MQKLPLSLSHERLSDHEIAVSSRFGYRQSLRSCVWRHLHIILHEDLWLVFHTAYTHHSRDDVLQLLVRHLLVNLLLLLHGPLCLVQLVSFLVPIVVKDHVLITVCNGFLQIFSNFLLELGRKALIKLYEHVEHH